MAVGLRWKRRPEGSTWGDFGPQDQLGRLNLLTPEKVKQGVAEVREGLTFCLSLPLEYPGGNVLNPRRHPPVIRPTLRGNRPNFNVITQATHSRSNTSQSFGATSFFSVSSGSRVSSFSFHLLPL